MKHQEPLSRIFVEFPTDIRHVPLERFPFSIVYREKEGAIQVLAFANHRRCSQYWC
jgi:toxin ParE1/3/4